MGRCVFLKVYRNEMWKEHELCKFLKYDKFFLKIPNNQRYYRNIYKKRVRNIENQCANFAAWNDNLNSTAACENAGAFDPVIHTNKRS